MLRLLSTISDALESGISLIASFFKFPVNMTTNVKEAETFEVRWRFYYTVYTFFSILKSIPKSV